MPEPDLEGFAQAQAQLRQKLGRRVTFWHPAAPVYDPETPSGAFDPERGRPFDIVGVRALNEDAVASASAMCSVAFQPARGIDSERNRQDALGLKSRLNLDLILGAEDIAAASGASHFELDATSWEIYGLQPDAIGETGGPQRYIVYGRRT